MSWMPCPNYSCSENVGGQCFGDGCERDLGDDFDLEEEEDVEG